MSLLDITIQEYIKGKQKLIFKEIPYVDKYKRIKGVRKTYYLKNLITSEEIRINKKNIQDLEQSIKHLK